MFKINDKVEIVTQYYRLRGYINGVIVNRYNLLNLNFYFVSSNRGFLLLKDKDLMPSFDYVPREGIFEYL